MAAKFVAMFAAGCAGLSQAAALGIVEFHGSYEGPVGRFDGYKPANGTGLPVFLWMPGTGDEHWPPIYQHIVYQMALRNFVAVSVDYNNADSKDETPHPGNPCGDDQLGQQKAKNVFKGADSALGRVCAMQEADCSQGVAVAGHSQGAFYTLLSPGAAVLGEPSYIVTAIMPFAASLGGENGGCVFDTENLPLSCVDGPQLDKVLPKSKRRYIIGEDDRTVGGSPEAIYKEYKSMSGVDCGDSNDCLQADGSGYYIIKGSEFENATCTFASHQTFFTGESAQGGMAVCDFTQGAQTWAMKSSFDWLANAATPNVFVVPDVADDFKGEQIPCGASCTPPEIDVCALVEVLNALIIAGIIVGICCVCCCIGLIYYFCGRSKN